MPHSCELPHITVTQLDISILSEAKEIPSWILGPEESTPEQWRS